MYLSKIELNTRKTKALLALRNPNLIHGALREHYPEHRVLWRIDEVGQKKNLLLQSEAPLSFEPLIKQFGNEKVGTAQVDLTSLIKLLQKDSHWRFRIKGNPVRMTLNKKTGKKSYCHYMNDTNRLKWLEERSEKNGFKLDSVKIDAIENIRFQRQGKTVSLASVTYNGTLTVTDPELFLKTFRTGLGHGKAYGLGMLSLATL